MNEIKYEAVFGDQSLFDDAIFGSIAVISNGFVKVYFDDYDKFLIEVMKCNDLPLSDIPEFAMRRIVKTPVWTVADWKAGRLPEVGAKLVNIETDNVVIFVGVNAGSKRWSCKDLQNGFLYFFKQSEVKPIESPEEKAQRLKAEWCKRVREQYYPRGNLSIESQIYDALLSGELKAPKAGE